MIFFFRDALYISLRARLAIVNEMRNETKWFGIDAAALIVCACVCVLFDFHDDQWKQ